MNSSFVIVHIDDRSTSYFKDIDGNVYFGENLEGAKIFDSEQACINYINNISASYPYLVNKDLVAILELVPTIKRYKI